MTCEICGADAYMAVAADGVPPGLEGLLLCEGCELPADVCTCAAPDVIYQPRCVHCGLEHYILNAPGVSRGEAPCHNCGKKAPVFETWQEYTAALKAMWEAEG